VVAVPARPAEGDASAEVDGDGESDAEALGEGDAVAEGDADGDAESVGDGDGVSVGDGEAVSVGDGDNVSEGDASGVGEGSVWAKLALPSIARWTVSRAESRTASAITRFRPTRAPNENCLRCVPLMSVTPHPRTASMLIYVPSDARGHGPARLVTERSAHTTRSTGLVAAETVGAMPLAQNPQLGGGWPATGLVSVRSRLPA